MRLLGIRTPEAPIDIKSVCTCLEFIHNHYHLSDKKTLYYFVRLSHQQPALSTCISPLNIFFKMGCVGVEPTPMDFQSIASTELAYSPRQPWKSYCIMTILTPFLFIFFHICSECLFRTNVSWLGRIRTYNPLINSQTNYHCSTSQ